jgi:permuted papain-like amidase YaeF/Yiix C92 family enzyme
MKKIALLLLTVALSACAAAGGSADLRPGDIVFQTSRSSQSQAVQLATHSRYSHMGLVLRPAGKLEVLEAAGQVKFTPVARWIQQGQDGRVTVKRLRDSSLLSNPDNLARLDRAARTFLGRHYDLYFEWSDERIYCSELVWKAFERGLGLRLGELATLGSFDLSSAVVKKKMTERYGNRVPIQESVISPAAIFESPLLETVH